MAVSVSGTLLLFALAFAGPLFYLGKYIYKRYFVHDSPSQDSTLGGSDHDHAHHAPLTQNHSLRKDDENSKHQLDDEEDVSHASYMLGLLGYAIGIGNVWRFPYLVGKYGGGAFVFAYVVCLFLIAMPLYFVELGLGQYTRVGSTETMNLIKPRWRSLGWAQIGMVSTIVAYYNVLLAYSCVYIIASCISPLPWEDKGSEAYWENDVLNEYGEGNEDMGPIVWKIVVALIFVYIVVFFSVGFGKKVLTDVTWVTVVGPILLMIILFCRSVMLPGARDGIEFYLGKFEWSELYNAELWAVACGQIIFSLSPGCGTAIALSSVVSPKEDVYRVCLTVAFSNSSFSLFGGFAIFSILGNLAHETGQDVSDVASESGTGLAFITIAQGITNFGSAANAMSVLFFVMLLTLGFDSTFAWLETIIATVKDICKAYDIKASYSQVVGFICVLMFIMGLPFCTRGGNALLDVVDHFVGAYFLLFSCFVESIMFRVDFGWDRFTSIILTATKGNPDTPTGRVIFAESFWKVCVCYIVPIATSVLLLSEFFGDIFVEQYGDGDYSNGVVAVGWTVFSILVCVACSTLIDKRPGMLPPFPLPASSSSDVHGQDNSL